MGGMEVARSFEPGGRSARFITIIIKTTKSGKGTPQPPSQGPCKRRLQFFGGHSGSLCFAALVHTVRKAA